MTVRGGGVPISGMASKPLQRKGPPLRSFAADAHDCIMVRSLWTYRIQGCGAMIRAPMASSPPQRVLQALRQGDEALAAQHHMGMLEARERQAEVVEPVRERFAHNRDAEL